MQPFKFYFIRATIPDVGIRHHVAIWDEEGFSHNRRKAEIKMAELRKRYRDCTYEIVEFLEMPRDAT